MEVPAREAEWYDRAGQDRVLCRLCPHECVVRPGDAGRCQARRNREGTFYAANYGRATAVQMDPVEKKPLYHFYPGREILSVGSWGCNLACRFCQNFNISQAPQRVPYLAPEELVGEMRARGSFGVAFTYNEPLVGFEYLKDAGAAVRAAGGKNVLVTNGYVNPGPLEELLPLVDAMNIDVKSFEDAFYREMCGGELVHVLDTVKRAVAEAAVHIELTLLVIPDANDAPKPNEDFARWLAEHCGADIPLHLSAYFPRYQYQVGPTQPVTLERLREIYARHLRYVYLGNVRPGPSSDTHCPNCGAVAIRRSGGNIDLSGLAPNASCAACENALPIVLPPKEGRP